MNVMGGLCAIAIRANCTVWDVPATVNMKLGVVQDHMKFH